MNTDFKSAVSPSSRDGAVRGLALVGFLALIAGGMWLAIYSARYLPSRVKEMGAAAVSLTSNLGNGDEPSLIVVPTTTLTANRSEEAPFVLPTQTEVKLVPPVEAILPAAPLPAETPKIVPTQTRIAAPVLLSGLPDLATHIIAIGYLTSASAETFVASSTIPRGARPAVQFVIKNIGTNLTPSKWIFTAAIPSQNGYVYSSPPQEMLKPGESVAYTLGFDQPMPGENRSISIVADALNSVSESNESNNSYSVTMTIPTP